MRDVVIVGGGLAGLVTSLLLRRNGHEVLLLEKNQYPFHRVCGEYVSNEVIPFLEELDLFPHQFDPPHISSFQLTSPRGNSLEVALDLGGFGVSRYVFDHWLAEKAIAEGVEVCQNIKVNEVSRIENHFEIASAEKSYRARVVILAHGKRSTIDRSLRRPFLHKSSPYVGVKYHIEADLPADRISLHNFAGGYCGVSRIEKNKFNLCYLTHRNNIRKQGSIEACEKQILMKNPHLRDIFSNSNFLFKQPVVISEISFARKEPVYDHLLVTGDAAGMITPLCGNGMAMAMHSAKIAAGEISAFLEGKTTREEMEKSYAKKWNALFATRLKTGRILQGLFGHLWISESAVMTGKVFKGVTRTLVSMTHGEPFSADGNKFRSAPSPPARQKTN